MSGTIYDNISQAFGNTPLVKLNRLPKAGGAEVLAKLEFYNPGASVKDRLGVAIIDAAEQSGDRTATSLSRMPNRAAPCVQVSSRVLASGTPAR